MRVRVRVRMLCACVVGVRVRGLGWCAEGDRRRVPFELPGIAVVPSTSPLRLKPRTAVAFSKITVRSVSRPRICLPLQSQNFISGLGLQLGLGLGLGLGRRQVLICSLDP